MGKKIDPAILAAAKSYEASLSESTPMTHYLVVWHDAGRTRMSAEWTKERAQAWAYQAGGECFSVNPIDGKTGPWSNMLSVSLSANGERGRWAGRENEVAHRNKTTPLVEHSKEACGVLLASIKAQNAISVKSSHV